MLRVGNKYIITNNPSVKVVITKIENAEVHYECIYPQEIKKSVRTYNRFVCFITDKEISEIKTLKLKEMGYVRRSL